MTTDDALPEFTPIPTVADVDADLDHAAIRDHGKRLAELEARIERFEHQLRNLKKYLTAWINHD